MRCNCEPSGGIVLRSSSLYEQTQSRGRQESQVCVVGGWEGVGTLTFNSPTRLNGGHPANSCLHQTSPASIDFQPNEFFNNKKKREKRRRGRQGKNTRPTVNCLAGKIYRWRSFPSASPLPLPSSPTPNFTILRVTLSTLVVIFMLSYSPL